MGRIVQIKKNGKVKKAEGAAVVPLFGLASGKIEAVQEESAEKGKKLGRKIKEYNVTMEQLGKTEPDALVEADPEKKDSR
jgi:hypothetical protein